jgi:hypothetical protein
MRVSFHVAFSSAPKTFLRLCLVRAARYLRDGWMLHAQLHFLISYTTDRSCCSKFIYKAPRGVVSAAGGRLFFYFFIFHRASPCWDQVHRTAQRVQQLLIKMRLLHIADGDTSFSDAAVSSHSRNFPLAF